MNDFELPVIKETDPQKRALSMDEYLEFVQFNLKHAFNRKSYAKWKKLQAVNAPFFLT